MDPTDVPATEAGRETAWLMSLQNEPTAQQIREHVRSDASVEVDIAPAHDLPSALLAFGATIRDLPGAVGRNEDGRLDLELSQGRKILRTTLTMNEGRIGLLRLSAASISDESDRVRMMYDRAAESYERFGGEFAHYWERYRSRLHGVVRDGDTLLDVGCGPGHLIADLPPSVAVFGCDVSPAMVELAARARSTGTFAVHDFHEPFPASWPRADVTTALGCLEFCTDLGRVIQNLATATKPGGLLLLTVPCIESSAQREILLRPLDITLRSWEDAEAEAAFGAAGLEVISHDRGPGYTAPDIGSVEYGFWELKNSRL